MLHENQIVLDLIGGADADRTRDLLNAIQALSQTELQPHRGRDFPANRIRSVVSTEPHGAGQGHTFFVRSPSSAVGESASSARQSPARWSNSRAARRHLLDTSPPSMRAISSVRSAGSKTATRLRVEPRRSSFSTVR